MASDVLGDQVDLNSGGSDLKFPHHENQMAQAEAHFDCCSWVNYFLHSGHLSIDGLKMSKSLKNFITVREALSKYSARQIRFLFLLHRYNEPMEYSENTMGAAADLERRFAAFDTSLGARIAEAEAAAAAAARGERGAPTFKWGKEERELNALLDEKRRAVHEALQDSINTPLAMKQLEQLLRATNIFMRDLPDATRGASLLRSISRYFDKVLGAFGVARAEREISSKESGGAATPLQLVSALSAFRDDVRQIAISSKKTKSKSESATGSAAESAVAADLATDVLRLCDELRDNVLPAVGVRLEDRASGRAQFSLDDPVRLQAEAARKRESAAKAEAERLAKEEKRRADALRDADRAAVEPKRMFEPQFDALFDRETSFGEFDETGLPIATADGEPLSKSATKKLIKMRQKHEKVYSERNK